MSLFTNYILIGLQDLLFAAVRAFGNNMSRTHRNIKTYPSEGSIEPQPTPQTCSHNEERYVTRFGDYCCSLCHLSLGWHPQLVREGVYGEYTNQWIATQGPASGECQDWPINITRIWKNK